MYVAREDGVELWVEQDGEGVPILLPVGAGVELYRRTLSPAFRAHHRIVYVEMRGSGGSTGSIDGATYGLLADDVEAVRVALELPPSVVLGHSNHGAIALEHALRHPAGNAGVLSVGSMPEGRGARDRGSQRYEAEATPEQRAWTDREGAAFAALDKTAMGPDEIPIRHSVSIAPMVWRHPELMKPHWGSFPMGGGAYFAWMAEAMNAWTAVDRLGDLASPVLAICGRYDYACPLELWAEAIDRVPDGRLEILEDSSHNPQVEEQVRFDELAGAFVARCAEAVGAGAGNL